MAFLLYSFFGGLIASAYTDFVQGFLIIVLSFMLIPLGLRAVGGFAGMRKALPANFFDLYSSVSGMDAFTIAMLALNGLVGITAQPHMLSMCATGATERAGRVGQTYGSMIKRFCTIGWALTGLIVAALVFQRGVKLPDAEQAFGYACRELLGPGLVGLMVACVLAANMSACSNLMVNSGALFTRNLWLSYLNPSANDRQLLWVGRLSGLVLTTAGHPLRADGRERPARLPVHRDPRRPLWRDVPRRHPLATRQSLRRRRRHHRRVPELLCGALPHHLRAGHRRRSRSISPRLRAPLRLRSWWAHLQTGQWMLVYKWLPGPFGFAMLLSFSTLIIVSLLTKPEDSARLEAFFDRMRRSTDRENLPNGQSKPLAADRGQELLLLDVGTWFTAARWRGFLRRYREDLFGFLLAWVAVGLLILVAWLVMQIGR